MTKDVEISGEAATYLAGQFIIDLGIYLWASLLPVFLLLEEVKPEIHIQIEYRVGR